MKKSLANYYLRIDQIRPALICAWVRLPERDSPTDATLRQRDLRVVA
jgi:hypothetical protein